MKRQVVYVSLSTLLLALLVGVAVVLGVARAGLTPVQADAAPSALEKSFFSMAVRAAVARHTAAEVQAEPLTTEDGQAGAEIYQAMCAECHGQLNGRPSVLGASFYPPAPQLPIQATAYSDREVFWIVKHGIRNTAMPAWSRLLSDDEIRKVAAFVKGLAE
ncbi:MAG TPA: cytochrome c [Blastocatellia bacterium]|nr:cytochrome c [Blastocatellia bacterium]